MSDVVSIFRRKLFNEETKLAELRRSINDHIFLLQEVITGAIQHNPETNEQVKVSLDALADAFRQIENLGEQNFPDDFWKRPEGKLLAKAYVWLFGDDLITLKEGACILFGIEPDQYTFENKWRTTLNTLTCGRYGRPELRTYYDPTPGTRYPMRLNRAEVLEFKRHYKPRRKTGR